MISEFFEEDEMFDLDLLIPTEEEIDNIIKKIDNNEELTFEDNIVLSKMRWCKAILDSRGKRI